jgi:hypothetical protein
MMRENLTERPKLHRKTRKRHYGTIDGFLGSDRSGGMRRPSIKVGVYVTDDDCRKAGDICASPALFEG